VLVDGPAVRLPQMQPSIYIYICAFVSVSVAPLGAVIVIGFYSFSSRFRPTASRFGINHLISQTMSWDENFMGCSITAKGYRSPINDFRGVFFGIYRA